MVRYFGPGCLAGITFTDWQRLLVQNQFRIAPRYLGKAAFITASSVVTSLLRPLERSWYQRRVREVRPQAPLFIVGCWRSGTTHLHNLLCLDERHTAPNLYQTMYPHTFLLSEAWLRPVLNVVTPHRRFMDNMSQGLHEPHEDEMALAIMTLQSNMLSWAFPDGAARYDRWLDFASASDNDREFWKSCFDHFVRKVALRTRKRLVLKSPNHTARPGLLRELYPDAKFVHIHRHPFAVYQSMCHMISEVQPVWGMQTLVPDRIPEIVKATYVRLYDAWFAQAAAIPKTHLHEVAYEDLVADPVGILRQIYEALHLGDFDSVEVHSQQYLKAHSSYLQNRHPELPDDVQQELRRRWQRAFDAWYSTATAGAPS